MLYALGVSAWPITPANKWLGLRIKDPWKYQNLTFSDYLAITERDRTVNVRLQEASLHHSHMAECYDYGAKRVYAVSDSGRLWEVAHLCPNLWKSHSQVSLRN